jgi:hypothetical protein
VRQRREWLDESKGLSPLPAAPAAAAAAYVVFPVASHSEHLRLRLVLRVAGSRTGMLKGLGGLEKMLDGILVTRYLRDWTELTGNLIESTELNKSSNKTTQDAEKDQS